MTRIPSLDVSGWRAAPQPIDASTWRIVGEEKRGLREKRWVQSPDGSWWLRKKPRQGRPFEPAIELIGLEAGRMMGLDSAEAALAIWRDDHGSEVRGICVLRFLSDGDHLVAGHELMRGADRSYDAERKHDHTLTRARTALRWLEDREGTGLVRPFMDLLLFDAWIGNGDRHPGNWSVMRTSDRGTVFTKMYDPGGLIGMVQLVREAAGTREWQERAGQHLAVIASILPGIQGFVDQLEEDWLPRPRKLLAKRLLEERLTWLRETL